MTALAPAVVLTDVSRTFGTGQNAVAALRGANLTVATGELLAVRGRSGSGKTTLLNVIGRLDRPDTGQVLVEGRDVTSMDETGLLALRRDTVSYVVQSFALIPILTATENVGLPLRLRGTAVAERDTRVAELLGHVGLSDHARQRPGELSGGQQQRVALARALAARPRLLLADEPTGQLDSATGREIMTLIRRIVDEDGMTVVVATHDPDLLSVADRVVELVDGELTA